MIAAIAASAAITARASTFTIGGSGNTFTVSRDDTTAAETVNYRTVSLSAYAGQHYTAKSGTLTFPAGQSAVTNTVTETTPTADAYRFQTGTSRYYRFELTDAGGFFVTNATRTLTTGTSVPSSGAFNEKSVTVNSGETTASDAGYISNPYLTMAATGYYSSNNTAPASFLSAINAELRMTLSMQVKEVNDGYQYIQVLFDNTTSCDDRSGCKDGNPGNISLARDAVAAA